MGRDRDGIGAPVSRELLKNLLISDSQIGLAKVHMGLGLTTELRAAAQVSLLLFSLLSLREYW